MGRLLRSLFVYLVALSCQGQTKLPVTADVAPAPSARFPATWYPADNKVTYTMAPQTDAPYTAMLVTTTRFINPATGKVAVVSRSTLQARDGAGRKRDEEEMPRPDNHGGTILAHEVLVSDPVAHCSFRWMEPWVAPGNPTAIVTCMPRTLNLGHQNIYADMIVSEPREVSSFDMVERSEPLGRRVIGDLEAVGVRSTRTRTNPQTGETLKLATEIWYSPDLKELLEMKEIPDSNAKASGSQIPDFELRDVRRGEPNPALFYPPVGYEIKPGY